jgi:hypothetical protein
MRRGEGGEARLTRLGEEQKHPPPVVRVVPAGAEAGLDKPVDELDRGMMADAQPLGEVADGRRPVLGKPFDRQQCLVPARGQSGAAGRHLAEFEKPPDQVAKIGQGLVTGVVEPRRRLALFGKNRSADARPPILCR